MSHTLPMVMGDECDTKYFHPFFDWISRAAIIRRGENLGVLREPQPVVEVRHFFSEAPRFAKL